MPRFVLMSLILMMSSLETVTEVVLTHSRPMATAPGDIIIGGLFSIHEAVSKTFSDSISPPQLPNCSSFYITEFVQALTMIHAVETANRSPMLTGLNITLGYRIYDICSDVTTALWAVQDLTQSFSACDSTTNSSQSIKPTMAVIGTSSSEISIAVARQLNLLRIPQISFASTAIILSDKSRFPAFMRTVPSDQYQTSAMVKLLKDNNWNWVGIIITDGDYGRSAMESFVTQAAMEGICVAFKKILPDSLTDEQKLNAAIRRTVCTIVKNPKVKVVVSFAKSTQMKSLFKVLSGKDSNERVWVASDNWSTATDILKEVNLTVIGHILGFTFKSGNDSFFHQYLKDLQFVSEAERNPLLREFLNQPHVGNIQKNITEAVQELLQNTYSHMVFSIQMAVGAVAKAVAKMCANTQCKNATALQPRELLEQLRKITFEKEGKTYNFDKNGDINLGYDVSMWQGNGVYDKIAEYNPSNISFIFTSKNLSGLRHVVSKCSNSCQPGEFKKTADGLHVCCYECIKCAENSYSNRTDMDQCTACDTNEQWSGSGSSTCNFKLHEYFNWSDGFAIVLLTLAALGILFLFLVSALFIWQRNSPVVKAAGGPLCQLILVSLLGSFISVVLFVGRPTDMMCKVRQVIFGLSFTLCVSCILVKSLKILLAFQINLDQKELLRRLYKPYVIICVCTGLQVIICTLWLILCSPKINMVSNPKDILVECKEGSNVAFGVMLAYIVLLGLVCFTFAYKGRKLPQKYNEAKFITFGLLIYLMAWVIFIPVHVTTKGKYVPAVEMVVILISNYGILSCHFLPKCYIILFKKEHNTKDAFLKNVYEYARKSVENIQDLSETEPELNTEDSVYTISDPQVVTLKEALSCTRNSGST